MWKFNDSNELCHYGVLGMKWGVRRGSKQSGSESISNRKKNRLSKKYGKLMDKARSEVSKNDDERYAKAWNSEADAYNSKKLRSGSKEERTALAAASKNAVSKYKKMTLSELQKNKSYQKGKKLCEKYDMTSFDKVAKDTADYLKYLND